VTIHELIEKSGFNRRTIYFYIQMELLPPPKGKGKNYEYSEEHLKRLQQIKKLQAMRYSLKEIREFFSNRSLRAGDVLPPLPETLQMSTPQPRPEKDSFRHGGPVVLWRKFIIGTDAELHIKWPPSEEALENLENQLNAIIQKIKGELK